MVGKTQGVYDLTKEVVGSMPKHYSEDIIEDVFLAIAASTMWLKRYNQLEADLGPEVVNA